MRRGAPEAGAVGEGARHRDAGAPLVCTDWELEGLGEAGGKDQGRGADDA